MNFGQSCKTNSLSEYFSSRQSLSPSSATDHNARMQSLHFIRQKLNANTLPPPPNYPAPPPPGQKSYALDLSPIQESSGTDTGDSESNSSNYVNVSHVVPHSSNASSHSQEIEGYHHPYARNLEHIENSFADLMTTVEDRMQERIEDQLQHIHDINHENVMIALKKVEELYVRLNSHVQLMEEYQNNTNDILQKIHPFTTLVVKLRDETENVKREHDQLTETVEMLRIRTKFLEGQVLAEEIKEQEAKVEREMRERIAQRRREKNSQL
jgi:hypothetical protein